MHNSAIRRCSRATHQPYSNLLKPPKMWVRIRRYIESLADVQSLMVLAGQSKAVFVLPACGYAGGISRFIFGPAASRCAHCVHPPSELQTMGGCDWVFCLG